MRKPRKKPADALRKINDSRSRLTGRYAFRMRPHLLRWQAEGMSQREIVALLNRVGAPVPSEYTGAKTRPIVTKQWSLVQYQRFRKLADEAHEAMAWWARRRGKSHVQPFGDGAGLFADPLAAGLDYDPNRPGPPGVVPALSSPAPAQVASSEDSEAVLQRMRQIDENYADHFPLDYADQLRYREILAEEKHRQAAAGRGTRKAKREEHAAVSRALLRRLEEREVKLRDARYRRLWEREQAELLRLQQEEMLAKSRLREMKRARGELPLPPPLPEIDEAGWRDAMDEYWKGMKKSTRFE